MQGDVLSRETVGKSALKLKKNIKDNTHSPIEQMREQLSDYDRNLHESVLEGKREFDSDFYIAVLTKKERLMNNVLRNYFVRRSTCPTPEWDQIVYKYHRQGDDLILMWVIPAKDVCNFFMDNALNCPPDQKELLGYVLDFNDGTLLKLARKLNGENIN